MAGIRVTATDLDNGDTETKVVDEGQYIVIPVEPMYLDGYVVHRNGTVQLTLKRRKEGE